MVAPKPETRDECDALANEIHRYLFNASHRIGHEWRICKCGLCGAARAAEKVSEELRRFARDY